VLQKVTRECKNDSMLARNDCTITKTKQKKYNKKLPSFCHWSVKEHQWPQQCRWPLVLVVSGRINAPDRDRHYFEPRVHSAVALPLLLPVIQTSYKTKPRPNWRQIEAHTGLGARFALRISALDPNKRAPDPQILLNGGKLSGQNDHLVWQPFVGRVRLLQTCSRNKTETETSNGGRETSGQTPKCPPSIC